ncbi:MAG: T9SS type A sorting domain-containing protein [Bacteroidota bacterium]|nr:T9SS type A sorting domain-containing protein [Bacteroidota bacterium]
MRYILLLVGGVLTSSPSLAQFIFYTFANSPLPSDNVLDVEAAPSGTVWAGTYSGLAKFDGTNWTIFDNSNSIIDNSVTELATDNDGKLWVGTEGGLIRSNGSSWVEETDNLGDYTIFSLAIGANGEVLVGTFSGGASIYDGTNWTTYDMSNSSMLSNNITAIGGDGNGNYWFGMSEGLARFDGTNWTMYTSSSSEYLGGGVSDILVAPNNDVWIAGGNGLVKYSNGTWSMYTTANSPLLANYAYDLAMDPAGNLWLAQSNSLTVFNGTTANHYTSSNSNLPYGAYRVTIDSSGNLWGAATGLFKFGGPIGIDDLDELAASVTVHPNPATDKIFISSPTQIHSFESIRFFDIKGRMVKEVATQFFSRTAIPVDDLDPGAYVISLLTGDFAINKKVIIGPY